MKRRPPNSLRFEARGPAAIDAAAMFESFVIADSQPENEARPELGATVVRIEGPLQQHDSWCWDSYEAISARFLAACAQATPTIVLEISSPGGDAAGCCELARELRTTAARFGKRLLAYVTDRACSAAYALASAAETIGAEPSAVVGSIGIIACREDWSARNAANGVRVAFVSSGARKADGNPDLPISDAELAAQQRIVDGLASVLFDLVQEFRGIDARSLQAGTFCAADALAAGLIDSITTLPELLLGARTEGNIMDDDDKKPDDKTDDVAAVRARLAKLAESDTPEGRKAKRALAALDAEDPPEAEDETPPPEDDKKEAARAYQLAARARADVHKLRAEMAAERDQNERERLIATRPDFDAEFIKTLAKAPIETVRELVRTMPRLQARAGATEALAAQQVQPLRGDDTSALRTPNQSSAEVVQLLDQQMGLLSGVTGVVETPYKMQLGVFVPKKAGQ